MKNDATFGQAQKMLKYVSDSKISCDQLQKILEYGALSTLLKNGVDSIDLFAFERSLSSTFKVDVDYSCKMDDLLMKGRYYGIDPLMLNSRESWSSEGKRRNGKIFIELIYFGIQVTRLAVINELKSRVLRPANWSELFSFGRDFPKFDKSVIALGSSKSALNGKVYSPCINFYPNDKGRLLREAGVIECGKKTELENHFLFAAVNKGQDLF